MAAVASALRTLIRHGYFGLATTLLRAAADKDELLAMLIARNAILPYVEPLEEIEKHVERFAEHLSTSDEERLAEIMLSALNHARKLKTLQPEKA